MFTSFLLNLSEPIFEQLCNFLFSYQECSLLLPDLQLFIGSTGTDSIGAIKVGCKHLKAMKEL